MKKFVTPFIAATFGSLMTVFLFYNFILKNNPKNIPSNTHKKQIQDAHLTRAMVNIPENTIDFTSAADASLNAVVHIQTTMVKETQHGGYINPFYEFFYGQGQMPQQNQFFSSAGSGVIIDKEGYIITNNHVIDGAKSIEVTLNDNRSFQAKVIGNDPNTDLALLKIEGNEFPYIPYGNSDQIKVGEWVLAIGNPFNLTSTVTAGIISAKGRNINIIGSQNKDASPLESFIQTDAAVNPGNSGGALVSTTGELIGINTAIKSNTGSYTGYSFAIPVNIVKKIADDLLEFGKVQRAFIGVQIRDITSDLAKEEGFDSFKGVYVSGVVEEGAAKQAGIKEGDVILKVEGQQVNHANELIEQVGKFRPGKKIALLISRNGEEKEVFLTLKNEYGNTQILKTDEQALFESLGAQLQEAPNELLKRLKIQHGVLVKNLLNGKLKRAGIPEGFIITEIDNVEITSTNDLKKVLSTKSKGEGILIKGFLPDGIKAYFGLGL